MGSTLDFAVSQYLGLGLLAGAAFLVGRVAMPDAAARSRAELLILSVPLGIGIIGHVVFLLGIANLIYRWAVCVALLSWVLLIAWRRRLVFATVIPAKVEGSTLVWPAAGLGLLMLAPVLALPLYPPTAWDSTEYYLAASKLWVSGHGLTPTPFLRMVTYPHLTQMLFVVALLFQNDILAQLTQMLVLLCLAGVTALFAGRLFSPGAGICAAALLLGTPLLAWLGSVAYIDLTVALFMTLTTYALWRWIEERHDPWILLAAAAGGFAASTKYNALPFTALLFAVAGIVAFRRQALRGWLAAVLVLTVVGAPSYVRNAWITGNPVFPMLPNWFGYSQYSADDFKGLMESVRATGLGEGFRSWIALPWRLTAAPEAFHAEAPLSPLYLVLLPALGLATLRDRRLMVLAGLVLVQTILWFYGAQVMRHLVPILPLLAVASAGAVDRLVGMIPGKRGGFLGRAALVVVVGILLAPSTRYAVRVLRAKLPIPLTPAARERYLARELDTYPAYSYLNRASGTHYRVYSLLDENMAYFADGSFMGDHFGPARFPDVMAALGSGEALFAKLRSMGADYFFVNRQRAAFTLPIDDFFHDHFRPAFATGGGILFELLQQPKPYQVGPNLIRNPGFEAVKNGQPLDWNAAGSPSLEIVDKDNRTALSVGDRNVFTQRVPMVPGHTYVLAHRTKALSAGALARLQINYACSGPCSFGTSIYVIEARDTWTRNETMVTPPDGVTEGHVYASAHGDSRVLFDDFSLSRIEP